MRRTRGWTGPRLALIALSFSALMARGVEAATITTSSSPADGPPITSDVEYGTTAQIGAGTGDTSNIVTFNPIEPGSVDRSITAPSYLSLGTFVVNPLPKGVTATFDHTPFSVKFNPTKINGKDAPSGQAITLDGFLNGKVVGAQSGVTATFNPLTDATFRGGDLLHTLTIPVPQVGLASPGTNGGRTTMQAYLEVRAAPIPEPATLLVFLAAATGLGLRRRLLAAR